MSKDNVVDLSGALRKKREDDVKEARLDAVRRVIADGIFDPSRFEHLLPENKQEK